MSFVAQCPYCGQKARLHSHALGDSVACPRCHNGYTAAPTDDLPMPASALAIPPATLDRPRAAADGANAAAMGRANVAPTEIESGLPEPRVSVRDAPQPAASGPATSTTLQVLRPRRRRGHRWIHLGGLVACLFGAGALLAASQGRWSFLTIPLSAIGLAVGIGAIIHVSSARPLRRILPIAGAVICGALSLIAWLAPGWLGPEFEFSSQPSGFVRSAVVTVPLRIGGTDTQSLEIDGFADATRAALHHDSVRVQIVGVTTGPVPMAVPKGPSKENYLTIALVIQHLGNGPAADFTHWGAAGVKPTPHPTLTQSGRKLAYHQMETEVVPGQVRQAQKLYPTKMVEDLLLFEAPAALESQPLQLELPAEAWGSRGVLRFHIPAAMIKQKQPKAK